MNYEGVRWVKRKGKRDEEDVERGRRGRVVGSGKDEEEGKR